MSETASASIYHHMLRGSFWAILMRSGIRGIGLVNTVVLARLLTPEDFGIVAMAAIVVSFLELFSDFGPYLLLIREPETTPARCNTAWTVRVLQGALLALATILLGPFAADYFQEPRITGVLHWLALSAFIGGFENVGIVLLRKELDFKADFRFNIYARLVTFVVVLLMAIAIRSYWALVWGQVLGVAGRVALSYFMHSYRPTFCFESFKDHFRFSLSAVPLHISHFLWGRADTLILGRVLPTAQLGAYNMANQLSLMFTTQLRAQINRALLPSYAKLTAHRQELANTFVNVQTSTLLLIAPVGLGLSAVAPHLVPVVFGEQWLSAIPLLRWTAVYAVACQVTNPLSGQILVVSGYERLSVILNWSKLLAVVASMVFVASSGQAQDVPRIAALVTTLLAPMQAYALRRVLPVKIGTLVRNFGRSLLAAALMVLAVISIELPANSSHMAQLILDVILGAAVYLASVLALWQFQGSPEGPESAVVTRALARLRKADSPYAP